MLLEQLPASRHFRVEIHSARQVHAFIIIHDLPILNRFAENRVKAEQMKQRISQAMDNRIGDSPDQVQTWFRNGPFNRKEITRAWEIGQAESAEGDQPTTLWGMVQGLTAYARDMAHVDRRVDLERRAGALLSTA
jgi:hypothetical protein